MTKTMIAQKVKDGWIVTITETLAPVTSESDILKLAKRLGLKVRPEFGDGKRIYAEG